MPSTLIHKLTGKDTRLSGFRHFELLVNVFVVVLLISNLVAQKIVNLIISGYLFKVIYEAAMTPLTYLVVNGLKRAEAIDVFDKDTNFNPFAKEEENAAAKTA